MGLRRREGYPGRIALLNGTASQVISLYPWRIAPWVEKKMNVSSKRILLVICAVLPLLGLWGCDYARMKDQEAVQTYKTEVPEMAGRTVPVTGGLQGLKGIDPERLRNPLPHSEESVNLGKEKYGFYCVMCHGPKADGNGTVGQSFYPLPANLRSSRVQSQSDGRLFHTITFGLNRQPSLGFMVTESDRWAIIHYLRSLSPGPKA